MNKIKKYAGAAVLSSMIVGSVNASGWLEGLAAIEALSSLSHLVLNTVDLGLDGYSIIKDDKTKLISMDTAHTLATAYLHYEVFYSPYDKVYETSKGDWVLHALNGAALVKTWSDGQRMDALLAHNAITQLLIKDVDPEKIVQGDMLSKVGRLALWSGAVYHIGNEYGYSLKGMIEDPHILHTELAQYLIADDFLFAKYGNIVEHLMDRSHMITDAA